MIDPYTQSTGDLTPTQRAACIRAAYRARSQRPTYKTSQSDTQMSRCERASRKAFPVPEPVPVPVPIARVTKSVSQLLSLLRHFLSGDSKCQSVRKIGQKSSRIEQGRAGASDKKCQSEVTEIVTGRWVK